ncbi:MAG: hypothetical protein AB7V16_09585 [Vulcanibacillus sp.]
MFGNYYRNNGTMFYSGLLLGGITGMVATIWFLGRDENKKDFNLKGKSMSDFKENTNQKLNNLDEKEKAKMFNKFIDPNQDESDLLDEFSKTNLTN